MNYKVPRYSILSSLHIFKANHSIIAHCYRRAWQPTPVFLPGNPQEQRSLMGYSPRGHKELDMTEWLKHSNKQFNSVAQSCPTLCDPMDYSKLGFLVHHQLPEPTQTHVHWVGDAIQPSHPLSSPSPSAFNLSQDQSNFQWVSSSHQVAKVWEFQFQHQSFQWIFRIDFL